MPPQTSRTSLVALLTGPLTAIPVTVALSLLALGWAAPSIRPWCLFIGVMVLVVTLGLAFSIWLLRQAPAPAPAPGPGPVVQPNTARLRAQFVKALAATPPAGRAVARSGTPAQTAYY
jgi:hypothetical protein